MIPYLTRYTGLFLLLAGLMIPGCSVSPPPPTHYFILNNPNPPAKAVNTTPKYPIAVSLGDIVMNAPYNSENLVVKLGKGEIQFFNYEKWSAPPEEMLRNYFYKALIFRNLFHVTDHRIRGTKSYQLQLEFEEFAHNREQVIHVGSLKLFAGLSQSTQSVFDWYKVYQINIPTESDQPADIVKALDEGLQQLLDELSVDIDRVLGP